MAGKPEVSCKNNFKNKNEDFLKAELNKRIAKVISQTENVSSKNDPEKVTKFRIGG